VRACSFYEYFAHYSLADTMAKTPQAALGMLGRCGVGPSPKALGKMRGAASSDADYRGARQFKIAPGIGATSRRSGQAASATSMRPNSSLICSSTH